MTIEILLRSGAQSSEEEIARGLVGQGCLSDSTLQKAFWLTLYRIAVYRPHFYLCLYVLICGVKAKYFTVFRIISTPPPHHSEARK